MNLLSYLPEEGRIEKFTPLQVLVLTILLTKGSYVDGYAVSTYSVTDLRRILCNVSESSVSETVRIMAEQELLRFDGRVIRVGTRIDGVTTLFCSAAAEGFDAEALRAQIRPLLVAYQKECARFGRTRWEECRDTLDQVLKMHEDKLGGKQVAWYFAALAEAVYQEQQRPLMAKDHGQISQMVKLYGAADLLRMTTEFLVNADAYYSGTTPSIGLLVYHKDKLFHKVRGYSSIARERMRTVREEEKF